MKIFTYFITTSLALAAASTSSAATYLAQTYTDDWAVSRDIQLTGTTTSGSNTSTALDGVLSVSRYTDIVQLARVVIRIVQADPAISPTIGATINPTIK